MSTLCPLLSAAFLGYALEVTLKNLLKQSGAENSPAQALKRLAEIHSLDIALPTVEGREIWLRGIAKLDPLSIHSHFC